jgi:hypothetical protein
MRALSAEIKPRWERIEGLHFGPKVSWIELAVDEAGNLIALQELELPGLPSVAAPRILSARTGEDKRGEVPGRPCFAGPLALLGRDPWLTNEWTTAANVGDEFRMLNLPLVEGNEDRSAGFVRIRELLVQDPAHVFPDWHQRTGENGSPRLFLRGCARLREQLSSAPIEADDEPLPRAAVSQRWEQADGGLVVALRYAALSQPSPSPSEKPEEWIENMRDRQIAALIRDWEKPRRVVPGVDYTW